MLSARPVDDNGNEDLTSECNVPLSDCKGNVLPMKYGWMDKGEWIVSSQIRVPIALIYTHHSHTH